MALFPALLALGLEASEAPGEVQVSMVEWVKVGVTCLTAETNT